MDFTKYNQIPTEFATAKEIGLAAATLCAMARRGMVEVQDGSPKRYRRIVSILPRILEVLEANKDKYREYFTLRKKDERLGMFCRVKNGEILDCWDKKYDLTDVIQVDFGKVIIDLGE